MNDISNDNLRKQKGSINKYDDDDNDDDDDEDDDDDDEYL